MRLGALLLACSALAAPGAALAADAVTVAEIEVKGQAVHADDVAYSATTLDQEQIRQAQPGDFDELFRDVPGMAVRDFGLGGVANGIVIRGFGNGGHGGDLGAVIDGVPLNEAMSHADGYVDFNLVIPIEVQNLTVYRGPVSALYGNYNRGGLVRIETRKGGDYLQADAALGSFETGDLQTALGREFGGLQLNLAAQAVTTDGYRPQSDAERATLAGRIALDLSPRVELALYGRLHEAEADSASYLTLAQFTRDPDGIDPRVQNDGANKSFASLRADLNATVSDSARLLTFAYLTRQDFTRWFTRPVGGGVWRQREEAYDREVAGAGASLNGAATVAARTWAYVAGVETFRERTDYQFYDGVQRRVRVGPAGSDRRIKLESLSAFGELNAPLTDRVTASLALRGDRFTGGCERRGPETGSDPCGKLNAVSQLSPKLGLQAEAAPWLKLRASWATGFALPNGFVKYAIGGQDLDPNIFRQTEIGVTLTPHATTSLDVAAFRLTSSDETRTVSPGVYENFGKTVRRGIEASGEWRPSEQVSLRGVYSWTDAEITENADARLVGKAVAGVPRRTGTLDLSWSPVADWSLATTLREVGGYPVDALNTVWADSYRTVDLTLAYASPGPQAWRAYARVENLADETYAATVSVIGGETVVAPGAPRALRVGLQTNF